MNNQAGVRMSTAITHLNPARHRLNLTVKGNAFVRRVLFNGGDVAGVEAESGGEIFNVAADQVVLSAGALKSPHILMLSGIGPREQLDEFGIPVVQDLPGVGQNLFNHPMGNVTFRVKDHVELHANAGALRFGLRVTSEPPSHPHDVMLHTLGVFNVMTGGAAARPDGAYRLRPGTAGRLRLGAVGLIRPDGATRRQLPLPAQRQRYATDARRGAAGGKPVGVRGVSGRDGLPHCANGRDAFQR